MTGSRLIVVFVSVLTGLVLAVMPVSAQTTNIDMSNDTKLLMRQMEMEASMKSIEESSRKESASSKDEYLQSVEILQQTLDRFFDCAPGLTTRMKEWMTIRASIEVAGKTIFKNGNDSIYKNLTKMMNRRMFTLPDAATMPGDMVWRRYKDAFIRTEKAFLGTSRITRGPRSEKAQAMKQLLEEVAGLPVVLWDERRTTIDAHQILMGSGKNGNGILDEGFLKSDKLTEGYKKEVGRIIDDVMQIHSSWVPSADKESFYQKKLNELNRLYAHVRGSDWIDFILESEQTDRMNINEEYRKILDKSFSGRKNR